MQCHEILELQCISYFRIYGFLIHKQNGFANFLLIKKELRYRNLETRRCNYLSPTWSHYKINFPDSAQLDIVIIEKKHLLDDNESN